MHSRKRRSRFLIETHSDYIIDRVRIEVRRGNLRPEDVSILYFEANEKDRMGGANAVSIHNLILDEHGNLANPPEGYRDFFLKGNR